jgi:transposase
LFLALRHNRFSLIAGAFMTRIKKSKRTDMRTYLDVFRLCFEDRLSHRQIALALGIGRTTVTDLISRFNNLKLAWPLAPEVSLQTLDQALMPGRDYHTKRVLPDWLQVDLDLKDPKVTKQLLWQEYQGEHGRAALGYTQYCEHYRRWKGSQRRSMRQQHYAGEKLFIDFCGPTVPIVDPRTGEVRKAAIFVATMGASNYTYIEACAGQDQQSWLMANSRCLEFLGGVPTLLVPDNLKAAVVKADKFEPILNANYQALARHYRTTVMPARPYKPKDKSKVEGAVLIIERWVLARLRHHVFYSLAALNQALRILNEELNARPMKTYSGLSRQDLFQQIDAPALKALPAFPYEYTEYKVAKVGPDYHLQYDKHYYSVPHALCGQRLEIQATTSMIRVHHKGRCVAQHVRSSKAFGQTSELAHLPPAHAATQEWGPERIRQWASQIGPDTLGVVLAMERRKAHPVLAQRACLALLNLQKRYSNERLERACGQALLQQAAFTGFIKNLLQNGLDNTAAEPEDSAKSIHHTNLRGPHEYQ